MTKGKLVVIALVMLPIGLILNGITLSILWGWFIITVFNVPSLTIAQALGIMMVVNYFIYLIPKHSWREKDNDKKALRLVMFPFLKMGLFLGVGWVIHLFI